MDGVHQSGQGEWGYCSDSCPISEGVVTPAATTPPPPVAPGVVGDCGLYSAREVAMLIQSFSACGRVRRTSKIINGETAEVCEGLSK